MNPNNLPASVLARRAIVYVRQSTGYQVVTNLESQRRQYALVGLAKRHGFRDVQTIDEDQGRSASGLESRPGFDLLVALLCQGVVGAVFCLEASRLARNGRDWHHLLELCGLVGARVVDNEGVYDPSRPNDRLLLGLKGTMSEFELTVIRTRLSDGALAKARRGELRLPVPVGYVWPHGETVAMDPDRRVQEAVECVFRQYRQLGSARQVHLYLYREGILFPRPADGKRMTKMTWRRPAYRNVITLLKNPFYAGAYAYGKSKQKTTLVDGRLRKSYNHTRPIEQWTVLLRDHHDKYIDWTEYENNQQQLAKNAYCKPAGGAKSARGGRALLSSILRCKRCGRMLTVAYSGRGELLARYTCRIGHSMHGVEPCINFAAARPDCAVALELLEAVHPLAVEAALMAEVHCTELEEERIRALQLELQQATYEAQLATRRYEAVDPDNRLVAAELELRWNRALQQVRLCEEKLKQVSISTPAHVSRDEFLTLAYDLKAVWNSPRTDMKTKQRLLRTLVTEIVADVDENTNEVELTIHWRGGQHSTLRVRKAKTGEHNRRASDDADRIIKQMATKWPDEHIAATLNRMGFQTGQDNSWNAQRVGSYRRKHSIHGYASANKDGQCLTMTEAANALQVSHYRIRRLIKDGILPAVQIMKDAPWQILAKDLYSPSVQQALRAKQTMRTRPRSKTLNSHTLTIPGL